jgi:hypothetical protein
MEELMSTYPMDNVGGILFFLFLYIFFPMQDARSI